MLEKQLEFNFMKEQRKQERRYEIEEKVVDSIFLGAVIYGLTLLPSLCESINNALYIGPKFKKRRYRPRTLF